VSISRNCLGLPVCASGTDESSAGVWYQVAGTGGVLEVSLIKRDDRISNRITSGLSFSVYAGDDCASLSCVGSEERYPIVWDSLEGEQYFVYVYSMFPSDKGLFDLQLQEISRPINDNCEGAIPVVIDSPAVNGTTQSSSTETDLDFCGEVIEVGYGGVWYKVDGSGGVLFVGVTAEPGFDSQLTVYSGANCGELTCVGGNDEGRVLDQTSSLSFQSEVGQEYFIFVHGWDTSRGDFSIEVVTVERPANDACDTAINVEPGDTMAGATLFAETEAFSFETCGSSTGGNSSSPGIWYAIQGTGGLLSAAVTATYDVQLTVFSGSSCTDLTCVDGTEGSATNFFAGSVPWEAEVGTTYFILVHGFSGQVGEIEFAINEVQRPSNDVCSDAIGLEVGDQVPGSNDYATLQTVAACGESPPIALLSPCPFSPLIVFSHYHDRHRCRSRPYHMVFFLRRNNPAITGLLYSGGFLDKLYVREPNHYFRRRRLRFSFLH